MKSLPYGKSISRLERCTLRVLMVAIGNGVVQASRSGSNFGLLPGGCVGPSNPGVSTNGSRSEVARLRSFAAAMKVALILAAVPPEGGPFIVRTRPLTRL